MALAKILETKRSEVENYKGSLIGDHFHLEPSSRNFYKAMGIENGKLVPNSSTRFILECKKASPSRGLIRDPFDLNEILPAYTPYANAISVLTDETYFQGSMHIMEAVSNQVQVPVLNKDFILDPIQIYRARQHGADAVLLMLSVLDDANYERCRNVAHSLNMGCLTEVHDQIELERALQLKAPLIGINNRNLKDLSLDLGQTEEMAPQVPQDQAVISESGIRNHQDVLRLRPLVNGFLVGSELMNKSNLHHAVKELIFSKVKICGLSSIEQARWAAQYGASYGGLIFYDGSPRCVSPTMARELSHSVKELNWVGVFVDPDPSFVAQMVQNSKLAAIQLHNTAGSKIQEIRTKIPAETEIWQAQHPEFGTEKPTWADRLVFDRRSQIDVMQQRDFDWKNLPNSPNHILAGGLNPQNINEADELGFGILDVNSGVETQPGKKSEKLIRELFAQLRGFGKEKK